MHFGIRMACGRCSSGFITTFIRVYIQNKPLQSHSRERRAPRAHREGPSQLKQTHNSISQNSSTLKAIQSPPQPQFLHFQPFLTKAGYKQAAPDSLWRLNSANIVLPPYQFSYIHISPFLCHQPSSPWVNPRFPPWTQCQGFWEHTHSKSVRVLEISAPTSTRPDPFSHLFEGKQINNPFSKRSFYKKHLFCSKGKASVPV